MLPPFLLKTASIVGRCSRGVPVTSVHGHPTRPAFYPPVLFVYQISVSSTYSSEYLSTRVWASSCSEKVNAQE